MAGDRIKLSAHAMRVTVDNRPRWTVGFRVGRTGRTKHRHRSQGNRFAHATGWAT
jgi:hypothetical protein